MKLLSFASRLRAPLTNVKLIATEPACSRHNAGINSTWLMVFAFACGNFDKADAPPNPQLDLQTEAGIELAQKVPGLYMEPVMWQRPDRIRSGEAPRASRRDVSKPLRSRATSTRAAVLAVTEAASGSHASWRRAIVAAICRTSVAAGTRRGPTANTEDRTGGGTTGSAVAIAARPRTASGRESRPDDTRCDHGGRTRSEALNRSQHGNIFGPRMNESKVAART